MSDSFLLLWFCLVVAASDQPRTVYHDRIDGLVLPACEPISINPFWPL